MRIIAKRALVAFYTKHADAETALGDWYKKTEAQQWKNFSQLRETFHSADSIGNKRIVFNIKGNDYRMVCIVLYRIQMVYIRFIGTHAQYSAMTHEQLQNI